MLLHSVPMTDEEKELGRKLVNKWTSMKWKREKIMAKDDSTKIKRKWAAIGALPTEERRVEVSKGLATLTVQGANMLTSCLSLSLPYTGCPHHGLYSTLLHSIAVADATSER